MSNNRLLMPAGVTDVTELERKTSVAPEMGITEYTEQITLLSLISLLFYLPVSLSLYISIL